MAHLSFTLDTFIQASPATMRQFLVTLDNHPKIHPLIISVRHDGLTTTADGTELARYRITDCMKLGPFNIQFTYRVTNRIGQAGEIIYEAFQSPRIHLYNTTFLQPEGSGTRLKEDVQIDAPSILMPTVYKGAIQSHQEMFARLKALFESPGGT
jgi:hypothetical protein